MPLALALAVWLGCTLARMQYEESILRDAFPEYADYACLVGALLPRWAAAPKLNNTTFGSARILPHL